MRFNTEEEIDRLVVEIVATKDYEAPDTTPSLVT